MGSNSVKKVFDPGGKVILEYSPEVVAGIAKDNAFNGYGRTAWVAEDAETTEEGQNLLTALLMWSSGDVRFVNGTEMGKVDSISSYYFVPDQVSSPDYIFQPIEAMLSMGYRFS